MSVHKVNEFVLKKSLGGIVMHKESKLVVRAAKDQTVIGRVEDELYIEGVDSVCIELCNQYDFKYDESLVITENVEEEVEEAEEVVEVPEENVEAVEETQEEAQEETQEEAAEETEEVQEETQEETAEETTEDMKSEVEQTELVGGKEVEISTPPPSSDLSKVFSDFQTRIQAIISSKDLALKNLQKEKEESDKNNAKKIQELSEELAATKVKVEKLRKAMNALQESM